MEFSGTTGASPDRSSIGAQIGFRIPSGAERRAALDRYRVLSRSELREGDRIIDEYVRRSLIACDTQGHLGFGKHSCLGASRARLEARVALESLVPELPCLKRRDRTLVDSFLERGPRRLELERAA